MAESTEPSAHRPDASGGGARTPGQDRTSVRTAAGADVSGVSLIQSSPADRRPFDVGEGRERQPAIDPFVAGSIRPGRGRSPRPRQAPRPCRRSRSGPRHSRRARRLRRPRSSPVDPHHVGGVVAAGDPDGGVVAAIRTRVEVRRHRDPGRDLPRGRSSRITSPCCLADPDAAGAAGHLLGPVRSRLADDDRPDRLSVRASIRVTLPS